jgi:ABC-type glycerol-3-phosphate transport system substrate-binding protein
MVLDPTGGLSIGGDDRLEAAPRTGTLDGATVGLLANGKHNGDRLLELVAELLSEEFEIETVTATNKGNVSRPAPSELLDGLTAKANYVITAIGD